MASKVCVAFRIRPLIERERDEGKGIHWETIGGNMIEQRDPGTNKVLGVPHSFDHVFGTDQGTLELYEKVVAPIVNEAFSGFNGTVLCYGQTSSGKTHTVFGNDKEPGIIQLAAQQLSDRTKSDETRDYIYNVGLMEIYNEKIIDLLDPLKNEVAIYDNNPKNLKELGLTGIVEPQQIVDAALRIQCERKVGATAMNDQSSRSHTIIRIHVHSVPVIKTEDDFQVTNAVLHFVDLAGSEKVGQTQAKGERFDEGCNINLSLSVLSNVVRQLCENSVAAADISTSMNSSSRSTSKFSTQSSSKKPGVTASKYVNFRDSKLTRILQSSLSGNAFIAMICNVTPASIEETLSTIRFAKQAKNIPVQPTANLVVTGNAEYQQKIKELNGLLSGKTSEVEKLKKELEIYSRFARSDKLFSEFAVPGVPVTGGCAGISGNGAQDYDRRKTLCSLPLRKGFTAIPARSGLMPVIPETFGPGNLKRKACSTQSSPEKNGDAEKFQSAAEISFFSDPIPEPWEANGGLLSPITLKSQQNFKNSKFDREVQTEDLSSGLHTPVAKKPKLEPKCNNTPASTLRIIRSDLAQAAEEHTREMQSMREYKEDELRISELRVQELVQELETQQKRFLELEGRNLELETMLKEFGALTEMKGQLVSLKSIIEKSYETIDRSTNTEPTSVSNSQIQGLDSNVGTPVSKTDQETWTGKPEVCDQETSTPIVTYTDVEVSAILLQPPTDTKETSTPIIQLHDQETSTPVSQFQDQETSTLNVQLHDQETSTLNVQLHDQETSTLVVELHDQETSTLVVELHDQETSTPVVELHNQETSTRIVQLHDQETSTPIVQLHDQETSTPIVTFANSEVSALLLHAPTETKETSTAVVKLQDRETSTIEMPTPIVPLRDQETSNTVVQFQDQETSNTVAQFQDQETSTTVAQFQDQETSTTVAQFQDQETSTTVVELHNQETSTPIVQLHEKETSTPIVTFANSETSALLIQVPTETKETSTTIVQLHDQETSTPIVELHDQETSTTTVTFANSEISALLLQAPTETKETSTSIVKLQDQQTSTPIVTFANSEVSALLLMVPTETKETSTPIIKLQDQQTSTPILTFANSEASALLLQAPTETKETSTPILKLQDQQTSTLKLETKDCGVETEPTTPNPNTASRPARKAHRMTQTEEEGDLKVQLHRVTCKAITLEKLKEKMEKTHKEDLKTERKRLAEIENKLTTVQAQKEQLRNHITEVKRRKVENQTDQSTECDLLRELLIRSFDGVTGLLPQGYPELGAVAADNKRIRQLFLEEQLKKRDNEQQIQKQREEQEKRDQEAGAPPPPKRTFTKPNNKLLASITAPRATSVAAAVAAAGSGNYNLRSARSRLGGSQMHHDFLAGRRGNGTGIFTKPVLPGFGSPLKAMHTPTVNQSEELSSTVESSTVGAQAANTNGVGVTLRKIAPVPVSPGPPVANSPNVNPVPQASSTGLDTNGVSLRRTRSALAGASFASSSTAPQHPLNLDYATRRHRKTLARHHDELEELLGLKPKSVAPAEESLTPVPVPVPQRPAPFDPNSTLAQEFEDLEALIMGGNTRKK